MAFIRRALLAAALLTPLPAWAQPATVLGGIDVYRSANVSAEWLQHEYAALLDSVLVAFQTRRFSDIGPNIMELRRGVDARGDIAFRELGLTTSFEADTNRVFIMLDVVDRADSLTRMAHFTAPPRGTVAATRSILERWRQYEQQAIDLVQSRAIEPVLAACPAHHCFLGFDHPDLRPHAAAFDEAAARMTAELLRTVREDSLATSRGAALFVLAHARDADIVYNAAASALDDPASVVRNNALRVMAQIVEKQPERALPIERVLRALDDPSSSVRNKAAIVVAAVANRPEYRAVILARGETLMHLLRLQQENNHEPALMILRTLSGENYAPRDYYAWERWLADQRQPDGEPWKASSSSQEP
jgi:hypothetical protein